MLILGQQGRLWGTGGYRLALRPSTEKDNQAVRNCELQLDVDYFACENMVHIGEIIRRG